MFRHKVVRFGALLSAVLLSRHADLGRAQELVGPPEPLHFPAEESGLDKLLADIEQEIEQRQSEVEAKVEGATTQPSDDEAARSAAARELVDQLKTFRTQIKERIELREEVRDLERPESAPQAALEAEELRDRIERLKAELSSRRPTMTEEELKAAEADWEAASAELASRTASQEERARRRESLAADRAALAAEVQQAQVALFEANSQHATRLSAAAGEAARKLESYRLRAAQVAMWIAQLRADRLEREAQRDALLTQRAEERIPLLRELVAQLQRRREAFRRAFARNAREVARAWVDFAQAHPESVSEYARAHWQLELEMLDAFDELAGMVEQAERDDRFYEEHYIELTQHVEDEREHWRHFMGSLDRRSSAQIKERYQFLLTRVRYWQARRGRLRGLVESTYAARAGIERRQEELHDAIRARFSEVRRIPSDAPSASEDASLRQELAAHRQVFEREFKEVTRGLDQLTARMDSAVQLVTAHVEELTAIRSRMYWSYLRVREEPLWKFRYAKAVAEWGSAAQRGLRSTDLQEIRAGIQSVRGFQWGVMVALCVAALCIGLAQRIKLFRHADSWEHRVGERMREAGMTIAPLSDRLHFQGIRFLARTALIVWPCLVAYACLRLGPLDERPWGACLLLIIAVAVAVALIRTLFPRSRIRFRLLPCSSAVALYYRRWMFVLCWVSVLLVPVPLLLSVMHWMPSTRTHLWAAYKILALVLVLIFAADRQMVLKVVGRPEELSHRALYAMVAALYPLIYLFLLGLCICQVVGYGPLTTYLVTASAQSAATLALAALLIKYITDVAAKARRRLKERRRPTGATEDAAKPLDLSATAIWTRAEPEDPVGGVELDLWIGAVATAGRWAVRACAVILVFGAWGVSWAEFGRWTRVELVPAGDAGRPAITLGRALLALAILAVGWVAARSIRTVMTSQLFPTYSQLDRGARAAVSTLLHYSVLLFGLYFALATLRIPLGALTVVLGTIGLGLGLGLQPLVLNFLSGIIMLFERHLKVGDLVEIDGEVGEVTQISMRATSIRTYDGVDLVVPNADFISRKVINWTMQDSRIRGKLNVGVAYGSDPRLVERLLLAIASQDPLVLADPAPRVRFANFGESSMDFILLVWFNNDEDRTDFLTRARYRIVEAFKEHGIEIPFPQRTFTTTDDRPIRVRVESAGAP